MLSKKIARAEEMCCVSREKFPEVPEPDSGTATPTKNTPKCSPEYSPHLMVKSLIQEYLHSILSRPSKRRAGYPPGNQPALLSILRARRENHEVWASLSFTGTVSSAFFSCLSRARVRRVFI